MSTANKTYEYAVRDRRGELVSGKLDAPNETAVVQRLRGMGYAPVSLREANTGINRELTLPFGQGVKLKYDGANMRFTNNADANQYLQREYRAGWSL